MDGTERIATVIKSSRQVLPFIVFTLNKSDHVKKTYAKWHLGDEFYRFENHTPRDTIMIMIMMKNISLSSAIMGFIKDIVNYVNDN